jgi:16S rRNA C1402 (ribose-2'-O) methylase RsmI
LPDAVELVKTIKKAALEAVESTKPVNVYFGTVESASPLKINVEQKMVLGESQLILTRNVTEYTSMITVQQSTEQITFHNALEKGEEVILIRQQEGQKYVVIDRIGGGSS